MHSQSEDDQPFSSHPFLLLKGKGASPIVHPQAPPFFTRFFSLYKEAKTAHYFSNDINRRLAR